MMKRTLASFLRSAGLAAALTAAIGVTGGALVACGGGDPAPDCTADTLDFSYPDIALRGAVRLAEATKGVPYAATPRLQGVPEACLDGRRFTVAGNLPAGMTLDATTGRLSGVPSTAGIAYFTVLVDVPLLPDGRYAPISMYVADASRYAYAGWDDTTGGHAIPAGALHLDSLGGSLLLTLAGTDTLQTTRSSDGGATWVADVPASAPPMRSRPAIASDGSHLVVAGGLGAGGLLGDVWVFDGSAWNQATASAGFGARQSAVLFFSGGHLLLVGGDDDVSTHTDVWRSEDLGASWTQVSADAYGETIPPRATCGADLGGRPVIVSSAFVYGTGTHPGTEIWSSDDGGGSWQRATPPAGSPLDAADGGSGQCYSAGGQLFVLGIDGSWGTVRAMVSSADLMAWYFQPRAEAFLGSDPIPGTSVLAGRLYAAFGATVFVTTP